MHQCVPSPSVLELECQLFSITSIPAALHHQHLRYVCRNVMRRGQRHMAGPSLTFSSDLEPGITASAHSWLAQGSLGPMGPRGSAGQRNIDQIMLPAIFRDTCLCGLSQKGTQISHATANNLPPHPMYEGLGHATQTKYSVHLCSARLLRCCSFCREVYRAQSRQHRVHEGNKVGLQVYAERSFRRT